MSDLESKQGAMRKRMKIRELPTFERPIHVQDKSLFHCMGCTLTTANDESAARHMRETTHSMVLSNSWHNPAATAERQEP